MSTDIPTRVISNRSMMQLTGKQPLLDWLIRVELPAVLTLGELNDDNESYLIPSFDDPTKEIKWVEKRWEYFFENVLYGWLTEEGLWPKDRTLKMFRSWFDIKISSLVLDLAEEPLMIECWSEDEKDELILSGFDSPDGKLH